HQPPNGLIGFEDLIGVIGAWGTGGGPYDVDGDETVGASDLVDVLARWGVCDG
ncbi:MAG: hypothetical protein HKN62_04230, partial [Phycisphaerales bacterium]|nr:hypothetical protein [Phycisphaerales bacterium]